MNKEVLEGLGFVITGQTERRITSRKALGVEQLDDGLWCDCIVSLYMRKFKEGRDGFYTVIHRIDEHNPDYTLDLSSHEKAATLFRGFIKSEGFLKELLSCLDYEY